MDYHLENAMAKIKDQIEAQNNKIKSLNDQTKINKIKVENYDIIEIAIQEGISNAYHQRESMLQQALFREITSKLKKHTKGLNRKLVKGIIGGAIACAHDYARVYSRDPCELIIENILEKLKQYMLETK